MNKMIIRIFSIILILCMLTNVNMVWAVTEAEIKQKEKFLQWKNNKSDL